MALPGQRHRGVGRGQDRRARTIVALERQLPRRRVELAREIEDVAYGRLAERVDRLRVVADDRQPAAIGLHSQQDGRL